MKTIELPTASRSLSRFAGKHSYILLTRKGRPVAYLLPTKFYDEEDIGYITDPKFWKMIDERRKEAGPSISLEDYERQLEQREREERAKGKPRALNGRNGKKGKRNG